MHVAAAAAARCILVQHPGRAGDGGEIGRHSGRVGRPTGGDGRTNDVCLSVCFVCVLCVYVNDDAINEFHQLTRGV